MESITLVEQIVKALDEKKGMDIKVLDIHAQTGIADYFVICNGTSAPHTKALSDFTEEKVDLSRSTITLERIKRKNPASRRVPGRQLDSVRLWCSNCTDFQTGRTCILQPGKTVGGQPGSGSVRMDC